MKSLKAAVLGCGAIGSEYEDIFKTEGVFSHAGAYSACSKTQLFALCDLDSEKLFKAQRKWGPNFVTTNLNEIFENNEIELLSIATPNSSHADLLEKALDMKNIKGILVEKPLALDPSRAHELVALAESRNITLMVNYSRRFSNGFQKCARLIHEGALGNIQWVHGFYTKGLLHNGTHWLDLVFWFLKNLENPQSLKIPSRRSQNIDQICADVSWHGSNSSGILKSLDQNRFSLFEMEIIGTQGRLKILDSGNKIEYEQVTESQFYEGYQTLVQKEIFSGEMDQAIVNAIENLCLSLDDKNKNLCSGVEALKSLQLAYDLVTDGTQ